MMKFTIRGSNHAWSKKVKFETLLDLAQHIQEHYDTKDLCCVEDNCGYGYNPDELVENLEAV